MTDIHSHILFGIDDGPVSLEESTEMLKLAAHSGIYHIAATSHGNYYSYSTEDYFRSLEALQHELTRTRIPVKLYPGMEIFVDRYAIERLRKKELLTLNHTKYILVEFPFDESPEIVCERIFELQRSGYDIVLAHPERYYFIQKDPGLAFFLKDSGCIMQINKESILGAFGNSCRQTALQFLKYKIAGVIATDAHGVAVRTPSVTELIRYLRRGFTDREIHIWMSENPARILKGEKTIIFP